MLLAGLLTPVCGFSLYAATISYRAITRLRTWESTTQTAAQYNQKAADQLHKTRTTQGAAAIAVSSPAAPSPFMT